jgi:hypothetical protein
MPNISEGALLPIIHQREEVTSVRTESGIFKDRITKPSPIQEKAIEILLPKIAKGERITQKDAKKAIRQVMSIGQEPPTLPEGKFQTIVVDPPWEMEKILREVRPKQTSNLDYPCISIEEIKALPIPKLATDNCHVYLWTTHKYLPTSWNLMWLLVKPYARSLLKAKRH